LFHLSISPIFHLHEGKTRRLPGNPDIANPTNAIESVFDVKPEGWMRWVIKVDLPLGSLHDDGWGLFLGSLELFG